jgi:VWFA-related protein
MKPARMTFVLGFLVVAAAATVAASKGLTGAAQGTKHTIYVSAVDKDGKPVTDLQSADFEVKEGGKTQEITSAGQATAPVRVAALVADQGSGGYQFGLLKFMQKLVGHAEFGITSVLVQPEKVLDYTNEGEAISKALERIGRRGRETGAQLMEAIDETTRNIRAEGKRPVILVMRVGQEGQTQLTGDKVREQLRKSGAILYVVSAVGADKPAPSQAAGATDPTSMQQGQLRDSEQSQSAFSLAQVLGDGAKESGGRHEQVVSTTMVTIMEGIADELLHQYEVTYTVAGTPKPGDKIAVACKRKGVTVRAAARLPS